ncbi:MAG: hypothetical protein ABEI74_02775 [Candidatus Pacearchaeota archaeon]
MENSLEAHTKKDEFPQEAYREFNVDSGIMEVYQNLASREEVQNFLENNDFDANSTTYYPRKEQKYGKEQIHEEKAIGNIPFKTVSVNKKVEPGIGDEAKENPLGVLYEIQQGTSTPPATA